MTPRPEKPAAPAITDTDRAAANAALTPYGYSVDELGRFVHPDGRTLGVRLRKERRGWRAVHGEGTSVWSGSDPTAFVRSFWHATLKTAPV